MNKPKVLILCATNPQNDPRPNRMISWLKDKYQVTVVSATGDLIDEVESIGLFDGDSATLASPGTPKSSRIKDVFFLINYARRLAGQQFEEIVWSKLGRGRELLKELSARKYDLIVSHDCDLLPFALGLKRNSGSKILFDAREYYTREFDNELIWRVARKPVFQYLCSTYLKECDKVITVSEGLSWEYAREYGIEPPEVIMSLPYSYNLVPSIPKDNDVRIIYHGLANAARRTEGMVKMMDYVDPRYSLDLMLVRTSDRLLWRKLERMVGKRKNVRIIPSVPMREIVPYTNQYDIGLFLCPPANLNLEFVLPNKLFEFIQARLAVAIGPNFEMKRIVEEYGCGIVVTDFDPKTMAKALNALTSDSLIAHKNFAHKAALELNANKNHEKIDRILRELLS